MNVAVVRAGSWGTTVASLAARNGSTLLWARRPGLAQEIVEQRSKQRFLPGFALPDELSVTSDLEEALRGADVMVLAAPSHGFRAVLNELAPYVRPWIPILSLAKGLEQGLLLRMTQIVEEFLPGDPAGARTGLPRSEDAQSRARAVRWLRPRINPERGEARC